MVFYFMISLSLLFSTEEERHLRANDRPFNLSYHYAVSVETALPVYIYQTARMGEFPLMFPLHPTATVTMRCVVVLHLKI